MLCSSYSNTMATTVKPEEGRRVEKSELWTKKASMNENIEVMSEGLKNLRHEVGKLKSMKKINFRAIVDNKKGYLRLSRKLSHYRKSMEKRTKKLERLMYLKETLTESNINKPLPLFSSFSSNYHINCKKNTQKKAPPKLNANNFVFSGTVPQPKPKFPFGGMFFNNFPTLPFYGNFGAHPPTGNSMFGVSFFNNLNPNPFNISLAPASVSSLFNDPADTPSHDTDVNQPSTSQNNFAVVIPNNSNSEENIVLF